MTNFEEEYILDEADKTAYAEIGIGPAVQTTTDYILEQHSDILKK